MANRPLPDVSGKARTPAIAREIVEAAMGEIAAHPDARWHAAEIADAVARHALAWAVANRRRVEAMGG